MFNYERLQDCYYLDVIEEELQIKRRNPYCFYLQTKISKMFCCFNRSNLYLYSLKKLV